MNQKETVVRCFKVSSPQQQCQRSSSYYTEVWPGWSVMNQKTDAQTTRMCSTPGDTHHMDGCMNAHTMNTNMNNCLKKDKLFLQLNWNPRLHSQLPHHHLWLIPQTLPSSNLQLSLQNLNCLYENYKMTLLPPSSQLSPPLLHIFPSHIEASTQSFSTCLYDFISISLFLLCQFPSLAIWQHVCMLFSFPSQYKYALISCISRFLRDSGSQLVRLQWEGEMHSLSCSSYL